MPYIYQSQKVLNRWILLEVPDYTGICWVPQRTEQQITSLA